MSTENNARRVGVTCHDQWVVRARRVTLTMFMGVLTLLPLVSAFSMGRMEATVHSRCTLPMTTLHATPPPNNANGRSSSTARDSAAHVEWEPLTELQRRIEDGVNYGHWPDDEAFRGDFADEDEPERVQGVFFGYRVTKEDYDRLKSAHPDDPDTFDI